MSSLLDQEARIVALTELQKSFLFEAGAGSGKTSLLAGRVVALMASGVKPENIVSVSFTELAAAELLGRIHEFSTKLAAGHIPIDVAAAFPDGLTDAQSKNLNAGLNDLGDMTCTTIHGFCKKMLRPYPVESGIDPGATILDPNEASLAFEDVLDRWLRKRLSGFNPHADIVTASVSHDPTTAVNQIRTIAERVRSNPALSVPKTQFNENVYKGFFDAVETLKAWTFSQVNVPDEHANFMDCWVATTEKIKAMVSLKPHVAIVEMVHASADPRIALKSGGYKKYKLKGAWSKINKAEAGVLNEEGCSLYTACGEAFDILKQNAASVGLYQLTETIKEVVEDFSEFKRQGAFLDFDDLLHTTHKLLKSHPEVLNSLREMYTHILVDEFQDTDPIQTDIFEMLSFDRSSDGKMVPVSGGIFFVGDPKQSVYRFRGADVGTYVRMREQMRDADPDSVKSIFVNFRSTEGIINFVNKTFEPPMSAPGQPGFTSLASNRGNTDGLAVMRYEVDAESNADDRRKFEANQIAQSVAHLIKTYRVPQKDGTDKPCEASDIALLAPVNTNLFWLENALEDQNIAVSTQAGKGMFQQQEIKDMIALTRVLGDHRDTLALGALLRGSFFGFTDEELLNVSASLPEGKNKRLSFLNLSTNKADINDPELAEIISSLAQLRDWATQTTPFDALSLAVNYFNLRAKTRNRDASNANRRLANIERYLEMSRAFDVRGIGAFSDSMRAKWEDAERVQEGRASGGEDAVSIITMHSAKGLEWPVVFMVNCSTEMNNRQTIFSNVKENTFTMKFMGEKPSGYDRYVENCRQSDEDERIRLMYVGLTRARDLLVIPDLPKGEKVKAWNDLVEINLDELDYLHVPEAKTIFKPVLEDGPTISKEGLSQLHKRISENMTKMRKHVPSRHENHTALNENVVLDELLDAIPNMNPYANVEGGAHRGNILHKLMEELLNGEIEHNDQSISDRAEELIVQMRASLEGKMPEIHVRDILDCVKRTAGLPQVKELWDTLTPEIGISSSTMEDDYEVLTMGVVDAASINEDGVQAIVDWKSDLRPQTKRVNDYRSQMKDYLKATGARLGLIVFMSTGQVVEVSA